MISFLGLAAKSLRNRLSTVILTVLAVAMSVALFLGVEKTRTGLQDSFSATISGTDLIVGARSGEVNLLLYAVFRIGNATANVSWDAYEKIASRDDVAWTVPISLGDSHRGYRVVGTTKEYFERYQYAGGKSLRLAQGREFEDLFDVVLGSEVARALGYKIGDHIILTHGIGAGGIADHKDRPFTIVGILAPTGTPVDRSVHVSLEAITAIHVGWETGARNPLADTISEDMLRQFDLTPKDITAVLVGLKRKGTILRTQRAINTGPGEPLLAVAPGTGLQQLWQITGTAETVLLGISLFVILVGLVTVLVSILTSLNERRREMAILRAVGASPAHVFALLLVEAALVAFIGAVLGVIIVYGLIAALGPVIASRFGVVLSVGWPGAFDLLTVAAVVAAAVIMALWPAIAAFRRTLADGLTVRV